MKSFIALLFVVGFSFSAKAYHYTYTICEPISNKYDREERELNQFDNLVVNPLRQQQAELNRQLDIEVNEPVRLANQNTQWNKDIQNLQGERLTVQGKMEANIKRAEELEGQADQKDEEANQATDPVLAKKLHKEAKDLRERANERRKDASQNAKRIAEIDGNISTKQGKVAANTARIQEITTTAPTESEIRTALIDVNAQLSDVAALKAQKIEDLATTGYAVDVCIGYETLKETVQSIRMNGCPVGFWPSVNPGVNMGRKDSKYVMACP